MANRNSSTMELNSILAEARGRRTGSSAPAGNTRSSSSARQAAPARKQAPAQRRSLSDDFIVTDDNNRPVTPRQAPRSSASYQQRPAQKSAPKAVQKPKKKKKTGLIVALCVVGIIVVAAVGGLTLYLNSGSGTGPESTFSDNVYVNGKSLKDMNMEQARALMKSVENELADGIKIEVKAGDKTYNYTKDDFNYSFDTETVLSQAKVYSEEKGIKTEDKNYEITMKVEDTTCEDIIKKISGDIDTAPKDATVTDFDPSADSMFTVAEGTKGVSLDEQTSLNALKSFIGEGKISGTVEASVQEVEPDITADFLSANITKLSSYSTTSRNNSNGNENMRVSLAACNGSVIDPGETWSFNGCTGDSNLESNGYKPAGVIVEGRSETGIGGGICQSSTTIYNACIRCGMNVVERECHYYKSAYVDAGLDATVDYGHIDLKVSNPFKYQLFMKCWMDGIELHCEIYGVENEKFDDVEISTTAPSYFSNGYTVHTTRTYLKDGEEVDSDELPSSTYYTSAPSSGSGSSGSSGSYSDDDSDSSGSDSGSSDSDSGSGDSGGDPAPDAGGEPAPDAGGDSAGGDDGGDVGGGEEAPAE